MSKIKLKKTKCKKDCHIYTLTNDSKKLTEAL